MNKLYRTLPPEEMDFLLVTDQLGNILSQASSKFEASDASWVWGMDEALAGKPRLSAGRSPLGWTIMTLTPLKEGSKQYGVLILGTPLNDAFARNIAQATNTQISFCSAYRILATSWPPGKAQVDFNRVTESILKKTSLFYMDGETNYSSFYVPIKIIDETPCLVINSDTTPIQILLRHKTSYLILSFLAILLVIAVIGSGLTYIMVRPLRTLQQRAVQVINEFSREDVPITRGGNEIATLSQAMELMLATIQKHLAELHQSKEFLRDRELFLNSIFSSIQDGIAVLDRDFTILRVNPTLERWFPDALPLEGKKCFEAFPGLRQICEDCVTLETLKTGETISQLRPGKLRGKEAWIEFFVFPLKDVTTGQVTGLIKYFRDVTERVQAGEEKAELEAKLFQAQKIEALGTLAGGIAHDFNNILTAIRGNIDLALQDQSEDYRRGRLAEAEKACQKAQSLVRQFLTFAKGGVPVKELLSLTELLPEAADFSCRGSKVRCDTILPEDLWTVEADPGQIRQVFQNLIINAIQAMPLSGTIQVRAENQVLEKDSSLPLRAGRYVKILVQDQGIGIPSEHLPKIFDPYFSTKKGSGLGLTTAYSIIKNHNGLLWVESNVGVGTTFHIYLPASEHQPISPPKDEAEVFPGKGRILVMDDEKMVRDLLAAMLTRLGYEAEFASDGEEAIELFARVQESGQAFDAVILDLTIPGGMGGKETLAELLQIDPLVMAIVSSGYSDDPIMAEFEKYGFRGVIAKPYKFSHLSQILHELIAEKPPSVGGEDTSGMPHRG